MTTTAPLTGLGEQLGLSPFWDWKTLESDHFRVTFPVELEPIAQKSTQYLEEAHTILVKKLHWKPVHKTQILVVDNQDLANGLTSAVQRLGIVLIATPPENWFSTAYYDDWLRLLCFHEYTHLVNMDPARGVWEVLRYVFGDNLLPNSIWPSWMLEGLAVYMETKLTRGGRGRSPFYEGLLRSAVEAGVLDRPEFITLDKVNGSNPYFPGGETAYLFGYQLMNQVSKDPSLSKGAPGNPDRTADGDDPLKNGEDALGVMSYRSGNRIPFFINGNLENITGKDWYAYWDDWVGETRRRMKAQLSKIKSQPMTQVKPFSSPGVEILGSAVSPDGQWIAYNQNSEDENQGLYARHLRTGEVKRLTDKTVGVGLAFTPDSKSIVMSSVVQRGQYSIYSDLGIVSLESGHRTWLTDRLRAKDPDLARDGSKIVFTQTHAGVTGLSIGRFDNKNQETALALDQIKSIYNPSLYDVASNPKFSPDGNRVVFSLHRNGSKSEELMQIDLNSLQVTTLVSNGSRNRYPAFGPKGELYFVSDLTGIDNLYRMTSARPELISNVSGGLWFPSVAPSGALYASLLSYAGWTLSQVEPSTSALPTSSVSVDPAPAPQPEVSASTAGTAADAKKYAVEDYSIIPSIWPRAWVPIPFVGFDGSGAYLGGAVQGFDAVDRHRYGLAAAYSTLTKKPDLLGLYSNRSLGPSITATAAQYTSSTLRTGSTLIEYDRKSIYSLDITYPIVWTYSSLTPSIGADMERTTYFLPSQDPDNAVDKGDFVPTLDATLVYSDRRSSRLSISPERGRTTLLGARTYIDSGIQTWKGLFSDTEYWKLFDHTVLVPSLKASWISRRTGNPDTYVNLQGRTTSITDLLGDNSFDDISIRGYPGVLYLTRAAMVLAMDYRFPLFRIFRGLGTDPIFFQNLYGFVFAETAYIPYKNSVLRTLPSAGGGVRLRTDLFVRIPLIVSLEYHQGFNTGAGGSQEVFLGLTGDSITF